MPIIIPVAVALHADNSAGQECITGSTEHCLARSAPWRAMATSIQEFIWSGTSGLPKKVQCSLKYLVKAVPRNGAFARSWRNTHTNASGDAEYALYMLNPCESFTSVGLRDAKFGCFMRM